MPGRRDGVAFGCLRGELAPRARQVDLRSLDGDLQLLLRGFEVFDLALQLADGLVLFLRVLKKQDNTNDNENENADTVNRA